MSADPSGTCFRFMLCLYLPDGGGTDPVSTQWWQPVTGPQKSSLSEMPWVVCHTPALSGNGFPVGPMLSLPDKCSCAVEPCHLM